MILRSGVIDVLLPDRSRSSHKNTKPPICTKKPLGDPCGFETLWRDPTSHSMVGPWYWGGSTTGRIWEQPSRKRTRSGEPVRRAPDQAFLSQHFDSTFRAARG